MKPLRDAIDNYKARTGRSIYSLAEKYGLTHVTLYKILGGKAPRKQRVIMALQKLIADWQPKKETDKP